MMLVNNGLGDFLLLPSLKWYTVLSLSSFIGLILTLSYNKDLLPSLPENELLSSPEIELLTDEEVDLERAQMRNSWLEENWVVSLVIINMAACMLLLFSMAVIRVVFGELRNAERNSAKDKFWNYVFYKFIFVFGVINVHQAGEVLLWAAWFSLLAMLVVMTKISKLRFEHLSFSPNTARNLHCKVLGLLGTIITLSSLIFVMFIRNRDYFTLHILCFLLADIAVLTIRAIHVTSRYLIHLYDLSRAGIWEFKGRWLHYNELILSSAFLILDLVHHLHMLLSGNLWLSMASLVICMHVRFLLNELQKQRTKHLTYHRVIYDMECKYPQVQTKGECLICWDTFSTARRLPCGHCFHSSCLRQWLEQDASCPICRCRLNEEEEVEEEPATPTAPAEPVWSFNLRRISNWLPSWNITVNYDLQPRPMNNTRLQQSATELQQIFPHISRRAILDDLRNTGSIDLTTDNILDGQLEEPNLESDSENEPAADLNLIDLRLRRT